MSTRYVGLAGWMKVGTMRRVEGSPAFMKSLRARIRRRLKELNLSAARASLMAGMSRNAIGELLSEGERGNNNPTIATLERLAITLDCDLEYLLGKQDAVKQWPEARNTTAKIPVVGTVEAGAFNEMTGPEPWLQDHEFEAIEAPRSAQFPRARHFAMRVRGDSMNSSVPRPIMDGEIALFVDIIDAEMPVTDGRIYLVRRTKDAGQSFEWTLKRARVQNNQIVLMPESTNKAHKPVIIPDQHKRQASDDGVEISAVGLLYAMHYSFE